MLLVTGKLQKIEVSSTGVKIDAAYKVAQASTIEKQVIEVQHANVLPINRVDTVSKGGVEQLSQLRDKKFEGLKFQLGKKEYVGSIITQYLRELAKSPSFEHIIIENPGGTLAALLDARAFFSLVDHDDSGKIADDFARNLAESKLDEIKKLPGYVGVQDSIKKTEEKGRTLRKMEATQLFSLPVVDEQNRFIGIVNRNRLVSSFLLEVADYINDPTRIHGD